MSGSTRTRNGRGNAVFVKKFQNLADVALCLFHPQPCVLCGASVERRRDGFVCAECWAQTEVFSAETTICFKCGRKIGGSIPFNERENVRCRQCDEDFYDIGRAVGEYEKGLRASVIELKSKPFAVERLGEMLFEAFQNAPFEDVSKIVPVPLSAQRRRERSFNQAEILAACLSKHIVLPCDFISLQRTSHTEIHRAGADVVERRKSVANAFEVVRPKLIENQKILLIDDVFTSGATASSCAESLKKSGAAKVFVLTLARAASRSR